MRQRASNVISRLLELIEADEPITRSGVPVALLAIEPTEILDSHPLDRTIYDDVLIANAIKIKAEEPQDSRVLVVSNDAGVLIKCKHFDLATWRPTSEMRLTDPLDEDQRELKRLRAENLRLLNAQPKLKLRLQGGKSVVLVKPHEPEEDIAPRSLAEVQSRISFLKPDAVFTKGIDEEELNEYNKALDDYYSKYSRFLKQMDSYSDWLTREVLIQFEIANDGTAPAEDLDIEIRFGDDIEPIDPKEVPKKPKSPTPPKRPRGTLERRTIGMSYPSLVKDHHLLGLPFIDSPTDRLIQAMNTQVPNVRGPWISKSHEPVASWHVRRLKHLELVRLPPIILLRPSLKVRGTRIEYSMRAANLPDPVEGEFSFGFQEPVEAGGEPKPQADA
jgi:hypothetical protein